MSELVQDAKLLVEIQNGIKTITINNPQAKNAVSPTTSQALQDAILASAHDATRVIILTGAENNFCSGADVSAGMSNPKEFNVTTYLKETINPIILGIRNLGIPVIAKVKGVAVGLGANFALACDLVYAEEGAVFSQIFTHIGLSSDGGGAYFMAHSLGYKKAFELMATASKFTAEEALAMGLINQVYPAAELDAQVATMAQKLASGPSVAIKGTKANLRMAMSGDLAATLEEEANNQGINFKTDDLIEGVTAFMQKRKANFKGK